MFIQAPGYMIGHLFCHMWTKYLCPKEAHIDTQETTCNQRKGMWIFIASLSEEGSCLEVFPEPFIATTATVEGQVVFIPYGCMLAFCCDVVHCGGISLFEKNHDRFQMRAIAEGKQYDYMANMTHENLSLEDFKHGHWVGVFHEAGI